MKIKRSYLSIALNTVLLVALLTVSCTSAAQMSANGTSAPIQNYLPTIINIQPSLFGIVVQTIDSAGGLDQAVAANASWARSTISWKEVQPNEGDPYNWASPNNSYVESQLKTASAKNIKVVLDIEATPDWALDPSLLGVCDDGRIRADKFAAYSNYIKAAVSRYGVAPYNLEYVEFYNEPDVYHSLGCWGDENDKSYYGGKTYGEMLKVVYPVIKAINPGIKVLVGGLLLDCDPRTPPAGKDCAPAKFLEGILADGAGPYFDGISFHGYDFYQGSIGYYSNDNWKSHYTTNPVVVSKANYLNYVLAKYNVTNKFLLSTESSIVCKVIFCQEAGAPAQRYPDYLTSKAYYVAQVYASSVAANFRANIWFSIYEVPITGNMGLISLDQTPLPPYYTYQFTSTKLAGAAFTQQISTYPGLRVYAFTTLSGSTLWVMWSIDQIYQYPKPPIITPHQITLPSVPSAVNLIGTDGKPAPQPLSQSLSVGIAPVFVEWSK